MQFSILQKGSKESHAMPDSYGQTILFVYNGLIKTGVQEYTTSVIDSLHFNKFFFLLKIIKKVSLHDTRS